MWLLGSGLGLAWLRQSQTCRHLLCRGAALRCLPHLRLCRSQAAVSDSFTDDSGRIRPEPVRTKRTEYVRAVFYVGVGLLLGSSISRKFAAFLEENDLFVPDDDDVD